MNFLSIILHFKFYNQAPYNNCYKIKFKNFFFNYVSKMFKKLKTNKLIKINVEKFIKSQMNRYVGNKYHLSFYNLRVIDQKKKNQYFSKMHNFL